jgi:predicted permease
MTCLETFRRDVDMPLRAWRRRPLLLTVVVLTLGLGFSATSIIVSVVNTVLLAPLPYGNPERLAVVRAGLPGQEQAVAQLSGPEVLAVQERAKTLRQSGAIWARPGVFGKAQAAIEIEIGWITPGFLESFEVSPQLGRLPTQDEYRRTDIIVLSDSFWRQQFGADVSIIGRRIDFDDEPRTVVGVMPPKFRMLFPPVDGVPESIEAWLPWGADLRAMTRGFRVFTVVGRVADDSVKGALDGELTSLARSISGEDLYYARSGFALTAEMLPASLLAPVRQTLFVLLCVVALVWVIACANVANLLLIRGFERSTEFGVRLALGAGRPRLWRQILTESTLIGTAGAAVGLLFAQQGIALLRQLDPSEVPRVQEISMDPSTLAAAAIAAIVAALFFGSVAARHAVSSSSLFQQGHRGSSARTAPLQRMLVVTQVALSVVLLTGAGLLVRSVTMLRAIELGFVPEQVVSLRLSLPDVRYPYVSAGLSIAEFYRRLDEMLLEIPGVRAAGATLGPPLSQAPLRTRPYAYRTNDGEIEWGAVAASYRTVTPGWTREIGVRLALGSSPGRVFRWILSHGLGLTLLGVAVGLPAAVAATRFLSSLLFNVSPTDGLTVAGVVVALTLTAVVACALPAARAAHIDPCESLKS